MADLKNKTHLEEGEQGRSHMPADQMAAPQKVFVFSSNLETLWTFLN